MLLDLFPFFNNTIPANEFERSVFALVTRQITDKKPVAEEIQGIENLRAIPPEEKEKRQKLAAELYLLLERNIAEEQARGRISREELRGKILRRCHPESAEGNFALMFLPHYERQIAMFKRFTNRMLTKAHAAIGEQEYAEFMELLGADPLFKDVVRDKTLSWKRIEKQTRKYTPPVKRDIIQNLLKRMFALLAARMAHVMGDLRVEMMFGDVYHAYHDAIDFIEDSTKILLIVPDEFLPDDRIALMGKKELEEQLRLKNQELETTLAEVQGEKIKLSELSRDELEKKVEERTGQLVTALQNVQAARAKLEEAKAKDDAFLENMSDGLIAIDGDWKIILWNKAASQISGWTPAEAMSKPLRDYIKFVKEHDGSADIEFIQTALGGAATAANDNSPHIETGLVRKDGTKVAVAASASPIVDERGKPASIIIVFRDITSERELQKTREEFASLATHELRTPVAAIKGYVKLLLTGTAGDLHARQKQYLEQVDRANERLLTLVNAMLDISRIELGTLAIQPAPTKLSEICESVLADLAPKIAEKKQELAKHYGETVPEMDVDPSLVHAIFQNLLSNAVKYTQEGGTVKVSIERNESNVLITVADTGVGIPAAQQSKVFEKLFRADNARALIVEGTGLGLYLVKSILDQTDGTIRFESEENKGTTFFVTMPLSGMKKREGLKGLS